MQLRKCCCCFFVTWILQPAISVLEIEMSEDDLKRKAYILTQLYFDLLVTSNCISVSLYGTKTNNIATNIYKALPAPAVSGPIYSLKCENYMVIMDKSQSIRELKFILRLNPNTGIIILILDECLNNDVNIVFAGKNKVILICIVNDTRYMMDNNGKFVALMNSTIHFKEEFSSGSPNYLGKRLVVGTFNCPPFVFEDVTNTSSSNIESAENLDGIELQVFLEVIRRLNFTWKLLEPTDDNKWGWKMENGSWSGGVIGQLVNEETDVGFCFLWMVSPQAEDIDLTFPLSSTCNTFMVPRPRPLKQLLAVFKPFRASLWASVFGALCFISIVTWKFRRFRQNIHSLDWHFLEMLGILTMENVSPPRKELREARHIITWWAMFTVLVSTAYSSGLASHLTVPLYEPLLNSIQDLVLAKYYWSQAFIPNMKNLFDISNVWHRQFIDTFQLDTSMLKATRSRHASLGTILEGAEYVTEGVKILPLEYTKLRRIEECISRYYTSLGLRKDSPYTEVFNHILIRLFETGIIGQWTRTITLKHANPAMTNIFSPDREVGTKPKVLTLKNIQGAFLLWCVGIVTSICSFIAEKQIAKLKIG
ncbi:Ionotropic receptor 103 [Blattella germanica]|nr:Ionotropic receptor 103 [Blattella germanica]